VAVPLDGHFVFCTGSLLRSLLKYPAMPRCRRFFVFPRREECASPSGSGGIIDEQRRKGEKAAQPGWRESFGLSGCVARSSQVAVDMLVARALAIPPKPLPRDVAGYFNRLLGGEHFSRWNFHLQRPPKKIEQHSDPFSRRQ